MLSVSPYKIEMYLRCPRQYKFEYVDLLRKTYHKETPALVIGNLLHVSLNHYYRRLRPEERSLQKLRDVFKEKFLSHQARRDPQYSVFGRDQSKVNEWVAKAVRQLENFFSGGLADIEPFLAPEENAKYNIEGDSPIQLLGKLDRVDKSGEGLAIVDYKTGRQRDDLVDPFQLDFYHLLLNYLKPEYPVVKKTYYYLEENNFIEVPIKENENEKTYKKIVEAADKMKNDQEFLPFRNHKCKLCDYKSICELWSAENNNGF